MRRKGGIAYREELMEVAAEIDPRFTLGQMTVLTKFIFPYVKQAIKEPTQHAIFFPHLGTFHMRVGHAKHVIQNMRKWIEKHPEATRRFKERVNLVGKQIKNFEEKYENFVEEDRTEKRVNSVHYKRRFFSIPAYRRGGTIQDIEKRILKIDDERRKFDF